MALVLKSDSSGRVLQVLLAGPPSGRIDNRLAQEVRQRIIRHGKIRLLFEFFGDFGGEVTPIWHRLINEAGIAGAVERLAIVDRTRPVHQLEREPRLIGETVVRHFDERGIGEAQNWISEALAD